MKRLVGTKKVASTDGTWAQATSKGNLIFISGQVPLDSDGNLVGANDFEVQAKQCLDNLVYMLEEMGASLENLACITVYLKDMAHRSIFAEVRKAYFQDNPPASTLVEVSSMFMDEILLELNGIAVL